MFNGGEPTCRVYVWKGFSLFWAWRFFDVTLTSFSDTSISIPPILLYRGSARVNSRSARVLLLLVVPGHMVFLYAISLLQGADAPPLGVTFTLCYLVAALLQVAILLYVADLIVRMMWRRSLDPDNFSIPYLTALGDLLGTGFLALCFRCTSLVHGVGQ